VLSPVQGSLSAMMLKTFMDETGIHDHAEMVAVGGYISNPRAWRTWTKDWNAHKRQVPEGHTPIKVFHSTDCANYRGEFEGWTREERDPYVAQLLPVIPANPLAGVLIGVHLTELERAFRDHAGEPVPQGQVGDCAALTVRPGWDDALDSRGAGCAFDPLACDHRCSDPLAEAQPGNRHCTVRHSMTRRNSVALRPTQPLRS
jgi:hypothetical protein